MKLKIIRYVIILQIIAIKQSINFVYYRIKRSMQFKKQYPPGRKNENDFKKTSSMSVSYEVW